jgi:hypothetical protein
LRVEICRGVVIGRRNGLGHENVSKLLLLSYFDIRESLSDIQTGWGIVVRASCCSLTFIIRGAVIGRIDRLGHVECVQAVAPRLF